MLAKLGRKTPANSDKHPKGFAARAYAVRALHDILRKGILQDDALEAVRASSLAGNDKAFAHAIVATSLRRHGQIKDVLQNFLSKPLPVKSGWIYENLCAAAAQILFLDIPAHAAIDMAVRLARTARTARHFSGLTNAVLRRVSEQGPGMIAEQDAVSLNIPAWMLDSWTASYGPDACKRIGFALLTEAPLDISVKTDAARWTEALKGERLANGSIRIDRATGQIAGLPGYDDGAWWVQDAAATFPVRLLGDVKGKRVLDLCAAPGGKTAQLAAAGAEVTALDTSAKRLNTLTANLTRLGLRASAFVADASVFTSETPFDAVIADVPCSATGTLRRHPDGLHVKPRTLPAALRPVQDAILVNAISLTKPGGTVVYCTCSLEALESEDVIRDLLVDNRDVARLTLNEDDVCGNRHLIDSAGDLRILPFHSIGKSAGMDGFYAARLIKA